ncbi:MAG: MarR family transcriptional regulator [Syntrophomonas sp.]|uniref:MarR family winged helix-turn-helix transcriptional regulator n=1 Tax=Syntrophomonas sp. TaxID=2053627 RepID=UPI0026223071|nr:MarR family transcriptional regulator [Syntrophomonas sp.]MDD2510156.1 MarR family transcriptional regulator [Syntrophomonas sp.]MDD3878812.1 MarR family transcriptional regulator [Syntrophomonas sp.]MDD4625987.1 MarR family transcriptional regulator [Syntrophomonas sp.]
MKNSFSDIYSLLQELAWHFGDHGINGECCEDLSMAEFMALKAAYENCNLSIQDIGNAINFTKSGATRIIDRLETKGYVKRERSSTDGRVCCVPVTDKGSQVISQIIRKNTICVEELLQDLEPQVIDNIKTAMEILIKSVHRQDIINSKSL